MEEEELIKECTSKKKKRKEKKDGPCGRCLFVTRERWACTLATELGRVSKEEVRGGHCKASQKFTWLSLGFFWRGGG